MLKLTYAIIMKSVMGVIKHVIMVLIILRHTNARETWTVIGWLASLPMQYLHSNLQVEGP